MFEYVRSRRFSASSTTSSHSCSSTTAGRAANGSTHQSSRLPQRQSSHCSHRTCEGISSDELRGLWRCMLELQERYGCYHSTRIDLAMEAGDEGVNLMPNPFIIDTLNESVFDLPDEGWEKLDQCLRQRRASTTETKD